MTCLPPGHPHAAWAAEACPCSVSRHCRFVSSAIARDMPTVDGISAVAVARGVGGGMPPAK